MSAIQQELRRLRGNDSRHRSRVKRNDLTLRLLPVHRDNAPEVPIVPTP